MLDQVLVMYSEAGPTPFETEKIRHVGKQWPSSCKRWRVELKFGANLLPERRRYGCYNPARANPCVKWGAIRRHLATLCLRRRPWSCPSARQCSALVTPAFSSMMALQPSTEGLDDVAHDGQL